MELFYRLIRILTFVFVPLSAFGEAVLNGIDIISGPRGTALTLSGDAPFNADFSAEGQNVHVDVSGVSLGLDRRQYEEFGSCPVREIQVTDRGENALRVTVRLKNGTIKMRAKEKGNKWIALLSSVPGPACSWRAEPAGNRSVEKEPEVADAERDEAPDPSDGVPPSVSFVKVLQRGAVAEVRIGGTPVVEVGGKVDGREAVGVFMGATNGLGTDTITPPEEYGFGAITIKERSRNGIPFVRVSLAALNEAVFPVVQTFSGEWVAYIPNHDDERLAVWEPDKGDVITYNFRKIIKSTVDYEEYSRRARNDLEQDLSGMGTFFINGTRKTSAPVTHNEKTLSGGGGSFGKENGVQEKEPNSPNTPTSIPTPPEAIHESPLAESESESVSESSPVPGDEPTVEPIVEPVLQLRIPVVITGNRVNLRSTPDSENTENVIGQLDKGHRAVKLLVQEEWVRILPQDGDTGWVHESLVSDSIAAPPVAVVEPVQEQSTPAEEGNPPEDEATPPAEAAAVAFPDDDISRDFRIKKDAGNEELPGPARRQMIRYRRYGRDPFVPLDIVRVTGSDSALADAENLMLVGIVYDDEERIALLEDTENDGKAYALMEGDRVRRGSLFRIMRKRVIFLLNEDGISYTHDLELEKEKILREARRR